MENRGLLFIPDISGFSRFVNAVELEHSPPGSLKFG